MCTDAWRNQRNGTLATRGAPMAMFGAAIALHRGTHMRMTLLAESATGLAGRVMEVIAVAVPLVFFAIVLHPAVEFAREQAFVQTPALGLVDTVRAAAVLVGMVLMLAACAVRLASYSWRELAIAGLFLAVVAGALFGFRAPLRAMGNWNCFCLS